MKVAVIHVTRMKVTTEQYNLLTETSNGAVTRHAGQRASETDAVVFRNFFINSGLTWSEVKDILDEINAHHYDGIVLWTTPGVEKLKFYSEKIISFVYANSKMRGKFNLCQRNSYLGPLKPGLDMLRFGYLVKA